MKKHIFRILGFLFLIVSLSSFNEKEKHIGRWQLEEGGKKIGYMTFDKEDYVLFEVDGKVLGGKESEIRGKKVKSTYAVNYDTKPFEIDIVITEIETNIDLDRMKGIFEFINPNQMKMNGTDKKEEERPKDFEGKDVIILTRVDR